MLSRSIALCVALIALPAMGFCGAIQITYSLTPVNNEPNTYIYTYSVFNDGSLPGSEPVELFDINFDPTLYQETSLTDVTPNPLSSEWSTEILHSAGSSPAMFDALELSPGITAGNTVSGFAVEFVYLGQGLPGAQTFSISDPNTEPIPTLQTGTTVVGADEATPEPPTGFMLLCGLLLCSAWTLREKISGNAGRALPFSR